METRTLRSAARQIFDAAVEAVDPAAAVRRHLVRDGNLLRVGGQTFDLATIRQVVVVGLGKAGASMTAAIEEIVGDRIARGVVVTKYGHVQPTKTVRLNEAGHPVPDAAGMAGSQALLDCLAGLGPQDLVLVPISGGGSALTPAPVAGISREAIALTRAVIRGSTFSVPF